MVLDGTARPRSISIRRARRFGSNRRSPTEAVAVKNEERADPRRRVAGCGYQRAGAERDEVECMVLAGTHHSYPIVQREGKNADVIIAHNAVNNPRIILLR